jgi:hypothetical protein
MLTRILHEHPTMRAKSRRGATYRCLGDSRRRTADGSTTVRGGTGPRQALRAALTPPAVTEEAAAEQKYDEKNDHPGFHGFLRRMNDETVF